MDDSMIYEVLYARADSHVGQVWRLFSDPTSSQSIVELSLRGSSSVLKKRTVFAAGGGDTSLLRDDPEGPRDEYKVQGSGPGQPGWHHLRRVLERLERPCVCRDFACRWITYICCVCNGIRLQNGNILKRIMLYAVYNFGHLGQLSNVVQSALWGPLWPLWMDLFFCFFFWKATNLETFCWYLTVVIVLGEPRFAFIYWTWLNEVFSWKITLIRFFFFFIRAKIMSARSFQIGCLSIKMPKMCRTLLFCI